MKEYDWQHKMKPAEYHRVCKWLKENDFREFDKTRESLYPEKHHIRLYNYHNCIDGVMIHIESYGSTFVDSHTPFIYLSVRLEFVQPTIVGISDYVRVCRLVTNLDELIELMSNTQKVKDLAFKTKVAEIWDANIVK